MEELTGCRIFFPKCAPDLNVLRYGSKSDSCDYSTSRSSSIGTSKSALLDVGRNYLEGKRRSPLCVADSVGSHEDHCERREMSEETVMSVVSSPLSVLTHAWERVVHARELLSLQHIMTTKRLGPSQMENRCKLGGREYWKFRSAASISSLDSSTGAFLLSVQGVRDIAVESGALCALWALALSQESPDITSPLHALGSSITDNNAIDCEEQSNNLMFILSDKLKECSFDLSSLLDPEQVICSSTIDVFAALASSMGPNICGRACLALQTASEQHQNSRFTARALVIKVLSALHRTDNNSNSSSVHLIFKRGGSGVTSLTNSYSSTDLSAAVCEGCLALLHAVKHEELQLCLSLPLSAAAIIRTRTGTVDFWNLTEGRDAEMVVTLGKMTDMEERDSMMKALWAGCVEDLHVDMKEKRVLVSRSAESLLPVMTVKAVALFHLWHKLRCSAETQVDKDAVEEGEEVEVSADDYDQIAETYLTAGWTAAVLCREELHAQSLRRLVGMLHTSTSSGRTSSSSPSLSSVSPDTRLAAIRGYNGDVLNIPRDVYEDGEVRSEGEFSMEARCGITPTSTSTSTSSVMQLRRSGGLKESARMIPAINVTDMDFNLDFQSDTREGEKAVKGAGSRPSLHQVR